MTDVSDKKAEIKHYEGVLERYGSGRWYDSGRRHLADLKVQLSVLERLVSIAGDTPPS